MQSAVTSEGDAWAMTLDSVSRFYERVLAQKAELQSESVAAGPLVDQLIGGIYPERAKLLGQRTAELHLALASAPDEKAFLARSRSTRWGSAPCSRTCARCCAARGSC
jgi:maltose alpha-D-glucosyltransferase/alpha-amylase